MSGQSASDPASETVESVESEEVSIPGHMRAAVTREYGTADIVAVDEVSVRSPGSDEVLIRVEASSLNALDWHFLTGTPYFLRLIAGFRRPKRLIPGADVAGTVVAIGSAVTTRDVGEDVFGEVHTGGCSAYLIANADAVVRKPAEVSFKNAAATPVAGLTALQGLRTKANLQPGESVLINGAAGGVGTFAVQIAKALGAEVTAVCSTRNVDMVRSIGADHVVDYTTDDFVAAGGQFDVMFDNVGNRTANECLSILRPDGRYVVTTGPKENPWLDPMRFVAKTGFRFLRAKQSFHQFTASPNSADLTYLGELLSEGKIVPQIQRIIGLDEVAEGLAEIGTGHARAKIVVIPD